jgi:multidrug efflux pump subunit AcrA (membrane-fusion protein)
MTISVDIKVDEQSQAMQIPMTAVHTDNKGETWVLRIQNKRAIKTPVLLGLKNHRTAQVVSGLQVGDALVPASEAGLHDGSHLRINSP